MALELMYSVRSKKAVDGGMEERRKISWKDMLIASSCTLSREISVKLGILRNIIQSKSPVT